VSAVVQKPKSAVNVTAIEHIAVKTLEMNAICVAQIFVDARVPGQGLASGRIKQLAQSASGCFNGSTK
jgi:bifunctional enzyme CysN/CysC